MMNDFRVQDLGDQIVYAMMMLLGFRLGDQI
jgi:hypothetical protein